MTPLFLSLVASFHNVLTPDPVCFIHLVHIDYVEQLKGLFVCAWLFVIVLKCEANCVAFKLQNCQFFLLSSPYVSNISVTITFIYQSLCYFDFL